MTGINVARNMTINPPRSRVVKETRKIVDKDGKASLVEQEVRIWLTAKPPRASRMQRLRGR